MTPNEFQVVAAMTDAQRAPLMWIETAAYDAIRSERDAVNGDAASVLQQLSAAVEAARDAAVAQAAAETERDQAQAERDGYKGERDALQAQLDAILNPPDGIYPYEFQQLLSDAQLAVVQLSADPAMIRLRTQLQTIVSPIPFGEGSTLRDAVLYLGQALPEVFTDDEVSRIIARRLPGSES